MTPYKLLALLALVFASGCSSFRFEPTANWLSAGGRLCAASREAPFSEFDRAAPRSCGRTLINAGTPSADKSLHAAAAAH